MKNVGDIVRLHRLGISAYKNNLQGSGKSTKGAYSHIVVDGIIGEPIVPRVPHSKKFNEVDEAKIRELRAWARANGLTPFLVAQFSELSLHASISVLCQVVAIVPAAHSSNALEDPINLFVRDGSTPASFVRYSYPT